MGKLFPKIDIVIAEGGLLRSRSNSNECCCSILLPGRLLLCVLHSLPLLFSRRLPCPLLLMPLL